MECERFHSSPAREGQLLFVNPNNERRCGVGRDFQEDLSGGRTYGKQAVAFES